MKLGVGRLAPLVLAASLAVPGAASTGCAAAIPVVTTVVADGLCVLPHFEELLAAEQQGAAVFILVAARIAQQCGLTIPQIISFFGAEKASRAHRAAKAAASSSAPACSSVTP